MVDGMRSMIYTGAFWQDYALELPEGEEKLHYQNLVDFMTPIIKAYCSDMGFRVCETAIQCLGGYGYCKEYPRLNNTCGMPKSCPCTRAPTVFSPWIFWGAKCGSTTVRRISAYKTEFHKFFRDAQRSPTVWAPKSRESGGSPSTAWIRWPAELNEKMTSDPLQWASSTYPALTALSELTMAWRLLDMAISCFRCHGIR